MTSPRIRRKDAIESLVAERICPSPVKPEEVTEVTVRPRHLLEAEAIRATYPQIFRDR